MREECSEDCAWSFILILSKSRPLSKRLLPFPLDGTLDRGKKFTTIEEMRESLTEFFASKNRDWYRSSIHQLEEQLQKVIESDGEYF
uniref:Uncharacterized protein n=1 Tax=Acrobeloides nanus TaxID=290746 RepID=A0A914BUU0_9BILA